MRKILTVFLILAFCFLTACQQTSDTPAISGTVSIIYDNQTILSEEITTTGTTAEDVLLEVCQKNKVPYRLTNHMFDGFGGYNSTETDGWILYVNDAIADKGAYEMTITEGFDVSFSYVNYDEIFSSFSEQ